MSGPGVFSSGDLRDHADAAFTVHTCGDRVTPSQQTTTFGPCPDGFRFLGMANTGLERGRGTSGLTSGTRPGRGEAPAPGSDRHITPSDPDSIYASSNPHMQTDVLLSPSHSTSTSTQIFLFRCLTQKLKKWHSSTVRRMHQPTVHKCGR